uniref:Uncharacterized protein n=1 Tax=Musca domestica TaxID=7370 RepID=A0A1I8NL84_MUSDO
MKLYWKLFSYLGGSIAFILSVEITYLMQVLDKDDWLVYFTSYTPCVFICRCRLLQFILSLELIRVELEQLNRELLQSAKGTGKAKLIPQSLHSIRHSVGNLCLSRKIQHFSLQICHQQIIFKAFGCFTIDCYIASGILGSIATYMMFYIQFISMCVQN